MPILTERSARICTAEGCDCQGKFRKVFRIRKHWDGLLVGPSATWLGLRLVGDFEGTLSEISRHLVNCHSRVGGNPYHADHAAATLRPCGLHDTRGDFDDHQTRKLDHEDSIASASLGAAADTGFRDGGRAPGTVCRPNFWTRPAAIAGGSVRLTIFLSLPS